MKTNFFVIVALVVFASKSCLSELITEDGSSNNGTGTFAGQTSKDENRYRSRSGDGGRDSKNTTKLINLDTDVLFLIFAHLNINDLLNLVDVEPNFHYLAAEVFRRKYRKRTIDMQGANVNAQRQIAEYVSGETISIYDVELFKKMLKIFGFAIEKIELQNEVNNTNILCQFINKYCSSLRSLTLNFISEDTLNHFTAPLKLVQDLSFPKDLASVGKKNEVSLNRLFPKLQRLSINLKSTVNRSFLLHKFPHLEQLNAIISKNAWKQRDQIEEFLRKNPQIRQLDIDSLQYPDDYFQFVKNLLPNLESLTIHDSYTEFEFLDKTIQFDHVKQLTYFALPYFLDKLSFPRLESVKMQYSRLMTKIYMHFFQNHKLLQRLHINEFNGSNDDLLAMIDEFTNLIEFRMDYSEDIAVDTIIKIIRTRETLMKFELKMIELEANDVTIIRNRLENEWHINVLVIHSKFLSITFERKSPKYYEN